MLLVGISVNIAMFTERVVVVVPTALAQRADLGQLHAELGRHLRSRSGAFGLFGFLYTLLTKFIPIVSLWEYKEGEHAEGVERVGGGGDAGDGARGGDRIDHGGNNDFGLV